MVTLSCALAYLLLAAALGPSPFDPGERLELINEGRASFVLCALPWWSVRSSSCCSP